MGKALAMTDSLTLRFDAALDRIEDRLPLIPRRVFRLQRAVTKAGFDASLTVLRALTNSADRVETSARTGVKTVTGQAKAHQSVSALGV